MNDGPVIRKSVPADLFSQAVAGGGAVYRHSAARDESRSYRRVSGISHCPKWQVGSERTAQK